MVQYGEEAGFIYCYLVKTGYRKRGIGQALFDKCVQSCSSSCNIGLSAEDKYLTKMYVNSGFVHRGFGAMDIFGKLKTYDVICHTPSGSQVNITPLKCSDFDSIMKFDDEIYPFKRHHFLTKFLTRPNMVTLVAKQCHKIIGYGCVWDIGTNYRIMPLYAQNPDAANELFLNLIKHVPIDSVINCSVSCDKKETLKMISEILQFVEEPVKMIRAYKIKDISVDTKYIYSTTNGMGPC